MMGKFKGAQAEKEICHFLLKQGLQLLERNYHCACGEIDLIMQDQDTIVFVEVRARESNAFGHPIETVNHHKQRKLIKSALLYLQKQRWLDKKNCRFDVVGVDGSNQIEWVKGAFDIAS
jgi:putative endonuclease